MPAELTPFLPQILSAIAGLLLGWLFTWLAGSGKAAAAAERLKSEERRSAEIEARLAQSRGPAELQSRLKLIETTTC